MHVLLVGNQVKVEQQESLQQTATEEFLGKNRPGSVIRMNFLPAGDGVNPAVMQELVAMIAADEIDVLVVDKKTFSVLGRQRNFLKLSVKRSDGGQHAYGIPIRKTIDYNRLVSTQKAR